MSQQLPDSLGNIDASKDNLLNDETFVQTKCYKEVLKDENFLIVGRKGVGKTAFAKMIPIKEKNSGKWSYIHLAGSPEIYFNDLERDFSGNELLKSISSSDFMYQLWEHFILESCMKIALRLLSKSPYYENSATIYNYLKSINQADLDKISTMSSFFSGMVEMMMPAIEAGGFKLSTGSGEKIREYFNSKHSYNSATEALSDLLKENNFSILFLIDDIDENLTRNSNEVIVEDFVVQLLNVVTDLNYKYLNNKDTSYGSGISAKAFIPTDIYSWLDLRHEDKFRSNKYELTWTDDEMRIMLARRIAELCRLGNMPLDIVMKKYFGECIYDIYGKPRDVFTYMIENTFGRPRDIMNIYKRLKDILGKNKVNINEAYQAISDYITETVNTIINEYSFVQPNLSDILQEFERADSLCDWEYVRLRVAQKSAAAVQFKEVGKVMNMLYDISLFGVLIDDPLKAIPPIHSLNVEYCYDRRRKSFKKLNFVMHPIFRYEYSMKDNSKEYIKKIRE